MTKHLSRVLDTKEADHGLGWKQVQLGAVIGLPYERN